MRKTKKWAKKRDFRQFTLEERIKIEIRYCDGRSFRAIAEHLGHGRNAGSICREVGGRPRKGVGKYQSHVSHARALEKRMGKKPNRS